MKFIFIVLGFSVFSSSVSASILTDRYLAKKRHAVPVENIKEASVTKEPLLDAELLKEYSKKLKENYWVDKDGASLMKNKTSEITDETTGTDLISENNKSSMAHLNPLHLAILKSKAHELPVLGASANTESFKAILGQDIDSPTSRSIKIDNQLIDLNLLSKSWVRTEDGNSVIEAKYKLGGVISGSDKFFEAIVDAEVGSNMKSSKFSCKDIGDGYRKCFAYSGNKVVLSKLYDDVLTLYFK